MKNLLARSKESGQKGSFVAIQHGQGHVQGQADEASA